MQEALSSIYPIYIISSILILFLFLAFLPPFILSFLSLTFFLLSTALSHLQVQLPVCSPPAPPCPSHSDSSDTSSEDDSTLVLLASSSRSPSPRTNSNKRQQRHHRSRSPAVPALQSLSLKPKDSPVSPRQAANTKKGRLFSPESPSPSLSPLSPANGISVPEALVAAILGEHRPPQGQIPAKSSDSNR